MKHFNNSRVLQITGLFLGALVWLANNANPPNGYTGAPFNSTCNTSTCHGSANSNGYDASVSIDGLPSTIQSNTVYPLSITVTPTAGTPIKAGFQMVAVAADNSNAGTLAAVNAQTGTESFGGRTYLEHRNGKIFGGGPVTWNFNWTSPATANGNAITFYYIANLTNNNNMQTGDYAVAFNTTYAFNGPPPVTASISSSTNVACFGGSTGTATVDGAGGIPPYTYHWSNNQTTQTAINLMAGTYSVTVTGSSGTGTATTTVVITQPPVIVLTASASGVITCVNQSATGMASATGGTPPFSYLWSNGLPGSTTTFTSAGAYTVVVTDNNGCTKIATVNVTGNTTPPTAAASAPSNLSCSQTSVTLSGTGSSTGANYTYLWSGPGIVSGSTTLTPVVNLAGIYILTVTNTTNGCTATASATVTSSATPPGATATGGTLTCSAPSVTLNGSSGTGGVSYSWSGPGGFTSMQQNPVVSAAGTYILTVTNPANNCTSTATVTVGADTTPPPATTTAGATITCLVPNSQVSVVTTAGATYAWTGPNGFMSTQQNPTVSAGGVYNVSVTGTNGCVGTGTASVTQNTTPPGASATGGTLTCTTTTVTLMGTSAGAQPTYAWNGPGGSSALQNFPVMLGGTYTLTVTSAANGCTSTASAVVASNTTPPVAAVATPNNLNCNNATVQLNGSASSQGANFTYLWTTLNGHFVSGATTLTPVVDVAGTYTLLVTNTDNGCTATANATVMATPAVTATIGSSTNVSCNGGTNGTATATPGGGNGTYNYAWSNGPTTAAVTNLAAGVYIVTISDGNCSATATITISQPAILAANATATGETASGANNGTATAAPTGGTAPFTYLWNTNATTPSISNLAPGAYTVVVLDANACSATQTVTVNSFNCNLTASISATNVSCNGASNGTATVSLTGAANPVTYAWSNSATTPSISGLAPGTYTVQIMDGNGCPAMLNVTISEPPALSSNATATGETATGANDGTATAQPAGGTAPYMYLWNTSAGTPSIGSLAPGTYTVTVTDANGCTVVQSVTVNAFNCAVTASTTSDNVSCAGGDDGQATLVVNGGTLPISYLWSNGANTPTVVNLAAGTYTATAMDGSGCLVSQIVTITQPAPIVVTVSGTLSVPCPEAKADSVLIEVSGGAGGPYVYTWSGPVGMGFGVGTYTVTITDLNGCEATQSFSITSADNIAPTLACPGNIVLCGVDLVDYPDPVASDNCSLTGIHPVLISGQPSGSAFDEGVSIQTFQVTDASGNTGTCSFTVTVNPVPDVSTDFTQDEVGGNSDGSIKVSASGGTAPYIFSWSKNGVFFSNDEDLTGISAGVYTLVVIDAKGCSVLLSPITIGNLVGTTAPGETISMRLVPNPAYTAFKVEMNGVQAVFAQIMDPRGQLIQEINTDELSVAVAVDHLPTGMYYLRILTDKGRWVILKWVKAD